MESKFPKIPTVERVVEVSRVKFPKTQTVEMEVPDKIVEVPQIDVVDRYLDVPREVLVGLCSEKEFRTYGGCWWCCDCKLATAYRIHL